MVKWAMQLLSKRLQQLRKDKEGSLAIEMVIGMLMMLMVFCLLMDILILTWKFSVIGQTNSYLARTASTQGGVLGTAPQGFPGGNMAYVDSNEMRNTVQARFAAAGIMPGDYQILINGRNITNGGTTGEIDYLTPFNTEIRVQYRWDFVNNIIPGQLRHTISSERVTMSEFKYRYDSWVGE